MCICLHLQLMWGKLKVCVWMSALLIFYLIHEIYIVWGTMCLGIHETILTVQCLPKNNKLGVKAQNCYSVAGLCGNFDGDASNDLAGPDDTLFDEQTADFVSSWRLNL